MGEQRASQYSNELRGGGPACRDKRRRNPLRAPQRPPRNRQQTDFPRPEQAHSGKHTEKPRAAEREGEDAGRSQRARDHEQPDQRQEAPEPQVDRHVSLERVTKEVPDHWRHLPNATNSSSRDTGASDTALAPRPVRRSTDVTLRSMSTRQRSCSRRCTTTPGCPSRPVPSCATKSTIRYRSTTSSVEPS